MVEASVIVSIIIAVISLLGSLAATVIGHFAARKEAKERGQLEKRLQDEGAQLQRESDARRTELERRLDEEVKKREEQRQDEKEIAALIKIYSPPLMLAAYELQARLYELVEFPISKEHLETVEGLEDLKIFTCYRFAQFLAWTYIMELKTQYFSFTTDPDLMRIGDMVLRLYEEFDRRRNNDGENIGVWPGPRLLVSARMLRDVKEKDISLDMIVKNYDTFHSEWATNFKQPMSYFCQWIDDMIDGRIQREEHWDDALRCTQHNLVAMVKVLDTNRLLTQSMQLAKPQPLFCDCGVCDWNEKSSPLDYRKAGRDDNVGLATWHKSETMIDSGYKASIKLEGLRSYTDIKHYNQAEYSQYKRR